MRRGISSYYGYIVLDSVSTGTMSSIAPTNETTLGRTDRTAPEPLSTTVDWILSVLLVLLGGFTALGGWLLFQAADRDAIARAVADGTITSTELTDAQLIDATFAMAWWGGIGLVAVGALVVVGGAGFLAFRTRARRRFETTGVASPDAVSTAVLGAAVTLVTSFLPLSPVIGGAVAGYFYGGNHRAGATVGGLTGLVAALPLGVSFVFLSVGLFGLSARASLFAAVVLLIAANLVALYLVGLGAIGGYVGVALADRDAPTA